MMVGGLVQRPSRSKLDLGKLQVVVQGKLWLFQGDNEHVQGSKVMQEEGSVHIGRRRGYESEQKESIGEKKGENDEKRIDPTLKRVGILCREVKEVVRASHQVQDRLGFNEESRTRGREAQGSIARGLGHLNQGFYARQGKALGFDVGDKKLSGYQHNHL